MILFVLFPVIDWSLMS